MSKWVFLDPWMEAVRANMTTAQSENSSDLSVLRVSLKSSFRDSRNRAHDYIVPIKYSTLLEDHERRQLREAMELVTILSIVDNDAFVNLMNEKCGDIHTTTKHLHASNAYTHGYNAHWQLSINGTLQTGALVHNQVSWSALLGLPNNTSTFSDPFLLAKQKLAAMGLKKAERMYKLLIDWTIELSAATVSGKLHTGESGKPFSAALHKLLDTGVPYVVQKVGIQGGSAFIKTEREPASGREFINSLLEQLTGDVVISHYDFAAPDAVELCVAVTKTSMARLILNLNDWDTMSQLVQHAGTMLSLMLSGSAICKQKDDTRNFPRNHHERSIPLNIACCQTPYSTIGSVCSAIANLRWACGVTISLQILTSEPISKWGWLVYAICCGFSNNNEREVSIFEASLTQTDLDVIDQVLKTRFPVPTIGSAPQEYGYVVMQEGAQFLYSNETTTLVTTTSCRCRAARCTDIRMMANMARVVVPGYDICRVKIGDGAVFIPDNSRGFSQGYQSRCIRALILDRLVVGDDSLVVELLAKIGKGLQKLCITKAESSFRYRNDEGLDLSVLAAICPELEELTLMAFDVVVSEHNEPLHRWPVKKMRLCETSRFPSLTQCLTDNTFLTAANLAQLSVTSSYGSSFSEDEIRELKSHDGEFLPLTKEKFPLQMKVALLSVVAGLHERNSFRSMDAYIVGIIFHFASTPVQRCVICK
ncbi:hypothetical protein L917_02253 [Phytophthora nicotianae]|uniref:Uncharacterized protein n=1 Tax=Phytophthora nicotianae TaxID=4792 RepID=W2LUL5_PHYNI|nr:hypothetical protein L917_02253 [Phytophthora nicotianae]